MRRVMLAGVLMCFAMAATVGLAAYLIPGLKEGRELATASLSPVEQARRDLARIPQAVMASLPLPDEIEQQLDGEEGPETLTPAGGPFTDLAVARPEPVAEPVGVEALMPAAGAESAPGESIATPQDSPEAALAPSARPPLDDPMPPSGDSLLSAFGIKLEGTRRHQNRLGGDWAAVPKEKTGGAAAAETPAQSESGSPESAAEDPAAGADAEALKELISEEPAWNAPLPEADDAALQPLSLDPGAAPRPQQAEKPAAGPDEEASLGGGDPVFAPALADGLPRPVGPESAFPKALASPLPASAAEALSGSAAGYYVVIGSYLDPVHALEALQRKAPWEARVQPAKVGGKLFQRVLVGPFAEADLPGALERVRAGGISDAWALPAPRDSQLAAAGAELLG